MKAPGVEARVGLFIFAALAVLLAFVLALGDFHLGSRVRIAADYAYAGDLQDGAPVKLGGLGVGRVASLELLPPPKSASDLPAAVRAHLEIDPAAGPWLTHGTAFYIGMQGIIGEAYVEVVPGAPGGALMASGSVVRGVDAPKLHMIGEKLTSLLEMLAPSSPGEEAPPAGSLAAALGALARDVDTVLRDNRTAVRQMFTDGAEAATTLRRVATRLDELLGPRGEVTALARSGAGSAAVLDRELPGLLRDAHAAVSSIAALGARLDKVASPDLLQQLAADMRVAAREMAGAATDASAMLEHVRAGEGSLGALIKDKQLYEDLRTLLDELKAHPWKLLWRD